MARFVFGNGQEQRLQRRIGGLDRGNAGFQRSGALPGTTFGRSGCGNVGQRWLAQGPTNGQRARSHGAVAIMAGQSKTSLGVVDFIQTRLLRPRQQVRGCCHRHQFQRQAGK